MKFKTGLGQDSHAFEDNNKPLLLAGIDFDLMAMYCYMR